MPSLYEINNVIANFEPEVDEVTGELLNADLFDRLNMDRQEKIESIALYIKNLTALSDEIKKERDNLDERMKAAKRKAESLKQYLSSALGGEKFETAKCKLSYRKTSKVVINDSFEAWAIKNAPDLITEKTEYSADKTAIKEAIKNGRTVVGAEILEENKLQVR